MTDLFDEVEEQLRSDRYRTLARKSLPWLLALLAAGLVVFLAVWGWQRYREEASNKASEQYASALDALSQGQAAQGSHLLEEVAKSPSKAYKTLALMQLAGLQMQAGKAKAAAALFDQAAAAAPDAILGDLARLKSAFAVLDTASYQDTEARLTPLMKDGQPYRAQAREALAFAKLTAGNTAGARRDFVILSTSLDAPEPARERAKAAMELIDTGSAKAVGPAAKAAATLPPPMPMVPGAPTMSQGGPSPSEGQPQAPGQP